MEHVSALVIGSGFGGAVAALRLGQAGIQTLVIERGKSWDITDPTINSTFTTFEQLDGRAEWLNDTGLSKTPAYEGKPITKYTGIMECVEHGEFTFLVGAGVGGGSHCYGGILIEPPQELWDQQIPMIPYKEMEEIYFPRVHETIGSSLIPDDILNSDYYLGLKELIDQAEKAGFTQSQSTNNGLKDGYTPFRMGIDWDIVREEIAHKRVSSQISAQFWFGQNSGAKQTLDTNYLKEAVNTGNVSIRPLHCATQIKKTEGGYVVFINKINTHGDVVEQLQISCESLFMAAGTLGTTELLLRAKHKGELSELSPELGSNLGNDGDTFAVRTNLDCKTNPHQGGPGAVVIMNYENPVAPCVMMRAPLTRFAQDFPEHNAIGTFIFTNTKHRGMISYNAETDRISIDYDIDEESIRAATNLLERFQSANGGDIVPPAVKITGHQLGGAAMGSVCDSYGRVVGYTGLYVVDGALLPGSSTCVNPALTISAVAERAMSDIIAKDLGH